MATYKLISSYTVGTAVNEIAFTSIPQTYTDLVLVYNLRGTNGGGVLNLNTRLNGVTTSSYQEKMMRNYQNSASQSQDTATSFEYNYTMPSDNTANLFGLGQFYFVDYTNSNQKKSGNSMGNVLNTTNTRTHIQWNSYSQNSITDAITSLSLRNGLGTDTFVQYSTAYLYGIKN
jgi:hypothetical protein